MPATYEPIATTTLGSAQASVTFSSISGTYTDLVLVASLRADTATFNNMNFALLTMNGTTTGYSLTNLYSRNTGSGDSALSGRDSNAADINFGGVVTTNMASNTFSVYTAHFMNYSNTTTYKTILNRIASASDLSSSDGTSVGVGLWRNTAAITSVSLTASSSGNWVSGSTFTLYGIKAA